MIHHVTEPSSCGSIDGLKTEEFISPLMLRWITSGVYSTCIRTECGPTYHYKICFDRSSQQAAHPVQNWQPQKNAGDQTGRSPSVRGGTGWFQPQYSPHLRMYSSHHLTTETISKNIATISSRMHTKPTHYTIRSHWTKTIRYPPMKQASSTEIHPSSATNSYPYQLQASHLYGLHSLAPRSCVLLYSP